MKYEFIINGIYGCIKTQKYVYEDFEFMSGKVKAMVDDLPTITHLQLNVINNVNGEKTIKAFSFNATSKSVNEVLEEIKQLIA